MEKLAEGATGVQATLEMAPPERVVNFVRRVIRGEKFYGGPERRIHLRYPITLPVRGTPLNDKHEPVGESFLAITRDISIDGLCMYHMQAVKEKLLQLELTSPNREQLNVLLEIVRCRAVGPFFEIAGRFMGEA